MTKIKILICIVLFSVNLYGCSDSEVKESTILDYSEVKDSILGSSDEHLINYDGLDRNDFEIDVDLTSLSATMVYAEVFNIVSESADYVGKTMLIKGSLSEFKDIETGKIYYGVIIADATACCAQGIEFEFFDEFLSEHNYPENGTEIIVFGEYASYLENDRTFYHLKDAVLIKPEE